MPFEDSSPSYRRRFCRISPSKDPQTKVCALVPHYPSSSEILTRGGGGDSSSDLPTLGFPRVTLPFPKRPRFLALSGGGARAKHCDSNG
jgi:hypothetical protein